MTTTFTTTSNDLVRPTQIGLQRRCACGGLVGSTGECAQCLARRRAREGREHDAALPEQVDAALRAEGAPLAPTDRAFMEARFGQDFSGVRLHTDPAAARAAEGVSAHAFTVGRKVAFASGRYAPGTEAGRHLLAHELAHVVQQSRGVQSEAGEAAAEREAETAARAVTSGSNASVLERSGPVLRRQAGAGAGAPPVADHRFSADGVGVVVRRSCAPAEFGFGTVESGVRDALDKIFNSDCIGEDRRKRIQANVRRGGLDVRCRRSANLQTPGACAESTGFFIPANIFTLGSATFPAHPEVSAGCLPLASTVLHEIIHLTRGVATEGLPASCEASCFGAGGASPDLCRSAVVTGG